MNSKTIISWIVRLIAAAILMQTLFFKVTGAEESKFIFTQLSAEPWGRISSGVVELMAAVLLLIPRTAKYGALLGLGLMAGAIGSHLTVLGIAVKDDGGTLFLLALVVAACCAITFVLERSRPFRS